MFNHFLLIIKQEALKIVFRRQNLSQSGKLTKIGNLLHFLKSITFWIMICAWFVPIGETNLARKSYALRNVS